MIADVVKSLEEAGAGSVIPYGNVIRLTEIDALLSTPDNCRDMVTKGQRYIKENLSIDVVADNILICITTFGLHEFH